MSDWTELNQRHLTAALALVRARLEAFSSARKASDPSKAEETCRSLSSAMTPPPALDSLGAIFGLSTFERELLLLAAGVELSSPIADLVRTLTKSDRAQPTFSMALASLSMPHWSALTPGGPLRRWRLIEVGSAPTLTTAPLRIDERILHYLAGIHEIDERLTGALEPIVLRAGSLVESHRATASSLAEIWKHPGSGPRPWPLVQIAGVHLFDKREVVARAAAELGFMVSSLPAAALTTSANELDGLIRLWNREVALVGAALLIETDGIDVADLARIATIARLTDRAIGPVAISTRDRRRLVPATAIVLDAEKPTTSEQAVLWRRTLGPRAEALNGAIDQLVDHFHLGAEEIELVGRALPQTDPTALESKLVDACRSRGRHQLDELSQRIEPRADWDDLILPAAQRGVLADIGAHLRARRRVYQEWHFADQGDRGLGISALFAGASGTGKTMAAEVLGKELGLDLFRIDLSQVVSKYIGETEKNLRKVFDAAESSGAILLFDEADALFGKRSEVKDSHDRYANIEVSYLLQRMEQYRGLAILTTNMKDALDTAFLRRLRFVIQFPFPDVEQRTEIWRRMFPQEARIEGLDFGKLAKLAVSGGSIRNIALYSAFIAADRDEPVRMEHLARAARVELAKVDRHLTDAEIGGWS